MTINPTLGRACWYFGATATDPVAAIITRVHDDLLVDVVVFPKTEAPGPIAAETLIKVRLRQRDEGYPKGARIEWMPCQIADAAFRKKVDEFADQTTAKADKLTELIEGQIGRMADRIIQGDSLSKLVAQQADSLITLRGQLGELHDRLSALEPNTVSEANFRAHCGERSNAPDAHDGQNAAPEPSALLGTAVPAEADSATNSRNGRPQG